MHGGRAAHVKAAAEERMRQLVHPAIAALQRLIDNDDLGAARYVLDYAGFKAAVQVQSEGEMTIRWIDEAQPIILERAHELGNGRADS